MANAEIFLGGMSHEVKADIVEAGARILVEAGVSLPRSVIDAALQQIANDGGEVAYGPDRQTAMAAAGAIMHGETHRDSSEI